MNVTDVIRELRERQRRIDRTIAAIEAIWQVNPEHLARNRRGRKAMTEGERREVSQRMKAYWAAWRRARLQSSHGERTAEVGMAAAAGAGQRLGDGRN
jgi:hypothetical protein